MAQPLAYVIYDNADFVKEFAHGSRIILPVACKGGAKRLKASLIASMIVYSHAKPQRAQRKIKTFILKEDFMQLCICRSWRPWRLGARIGLFLFVSQELLVYQEFILCVIDHWLKFAFRLETGVAAARFSAHSPQPRLSGKRMQRYGQSRRAEICPVRCLVASTRTS